MQDITFAQALKATIPHLAPVKERLPLLSVVHLYNDRALATDRYSLARSRFSTHIEGLESHFQLTMEDAKRLSKDKRGIQCIVYESGTDRLVITYTSGDEEVVYNWNADKNGYSVPPFERLIPSRDDNRPIVPAQVRPLFMPRFAERHLARGKREKLMNVSFVAREEQWPVLWTFSDHTDGAVMPARN